MVQYLYDGGRSCKTMCNGTCPNPLSFNTWACFHAHTYWCPNLPRAACRNTASESQTNGKHSMTARLLYVYLACWLCAICFILLPFLMGGEETKILVYSSTFYTVKLKSSLHCYIERRDVVQRWNAASSWVKISILETANVGSCVLLNPGGLCKAAGILSGSAHTTEQGIRWSWSQIVWQTVCLCYWWTAFTVSALSWAIPGHHLRDCWFAQAEAEAGKWVSSSTEDGKSEPSLCPPHLFY